ILENAKTIFDKVPVYHIQLRQKASEYKSQEAFEIGFQTLQELGVDVPIVSDSRTLKKAFIQQMKKFKEFMKERKITDLFNLPEVKNQKIIEAIAIVTNLGDIAIAMKPEMLPLVSVLGTNLSLLYGNTKFSPISYVMMGVILNLFFKDYQAGYELGQVALKLNQLKFPSDLIYGKVLAFYGWNINHWIYHTNEDLEISKQGDEITMKNSDFVYASYFQIMFVKVAFYCAADLEEVSHYAKKCFEFGEKYKIPFTTSMAIPTYQTVLALQGETKKPTSFETDSYGEEEYIKKHKDYGQPMAYHYLRKFQLHYLFGEYGKCWNILPKVEKYFPNIPQHIAFSEFHFFNALTLLALFPILIEEDRKVSQPKLDRSFQYLKLWSEHCKPNFLHKLYLVEAEKAKIENKENEAIRFYNLSIESAIHYSYTQNAALANELAGMFFISKGVYPIASQYFQEAEYLYKTWGQRQKHRMLPKNQYSNVGSRRNVYKIWKREQNNLYIFTNH
ncbi:MAG: hypothetical protein KDK90_28755, partial [Leptospiraceae bacterium]|nr:hypothetical protein [Leptospiraceae bacterium]